MLQLLRRLDGRRTLTGSGLAAGLCWTLQYLRFLTQTIHIQAKNE